MQQMATLPVIIKLSRNYPDHQPIILLTQGKFKSSSLIACSVLARASRMHIKDDQISAVAMKPDYGVKG
jgi:hypothetical protein